MFRTLHRTALSATALTLGAAGLALVAATPAHAAGNVSISFTDSVSNAPVAKPANLWVQYARTGQADQMRTMGFDAVTGAFRTTGLADGEYMLRVETDTTPATALDRYYPSDWASFTVTNGAPVTLAKALSPRAAALFTVTDSRGEPVIMRPDATGHVAGNVSLRFQYDGSEGFGVGWGGPQYGPIGTDEQGVYVHTSDNRSAIKFHPAPGSTDHWEWFGGPSATRKAYTFDDSAKVKVDPTQLVPQTYSVQLGPKPAITEGAVQVTGTLQVGQTLTAETSGWAPANATFSYQWIRGVGIDIPGATDRQLALRTWAGEEPPEDSGIGVRVIAQVSGQPSVEKEVWHPSFGLAAGDEPVTHTRPTVSGVPQVGRPLTAQDGTWGPAGVTLTHQWLANGAVIDGATGSTFTPTAAEIGTTISVRTTGALGGYATVVRDSVATTTVAAQPVITAGTPVISGRPVVGQELTVDDGAWGPAGVALTRQWLASGTVIDGATGTTFTPTAAQLGQPLSVRVTGTLDHAVSQSVTSTATHDVVPMLTPGSVRVSGTVRTGQVLTAVTSGSSPAGASFAGHQWLADGAPIPGATSRTFTVTNSQAGKRLGVRVRASFTSGAVVQDRQITSAPTTRSTGILKAATPRITGRAKVGKKLTAKTGAWSPRPTMRYQWLRNGKVIKKATRSSYKLTSTDRGKRIQVRVTGTKTSYLTVVRTSARTVAVKR